jgi:hypothetical protein
MMTVMIEAFLRLDRAKRELDVDITNMFNELCRVTLMEDMLTSEERLGVDFSDKAAYFDMAFMQDYGNRFWVVEATASRVDTCTPGPLAIEVPGYPTQ